MLTEWTPDKRFIQSTHLAQWMNQLSIPTVRGFHEWSCENKDLFWETIIEKLQIVFQKTFTTVCDLSKGVESPQWLMNAKMNIAESCFIADPQKTAIITLDQNHALRKISYEMLNQLSNQVAFSLAKQGCIPGDRIAIALPMTFEAVAVFLGIIKLGGVVVSIAESFSSQEIMTRLQVANVKVVITQDIMVRQAKKIPLYQKLIDANAPCCIVITHEKSSSDIPLRKNDLLWDHFLSENTDWISHPSNPMDPCLILFSSGTTHTPKAIPWNHTTPIKAASDAYLHMNFISNDIVAWPTSLGWMMGPWLIFATLINQSTIALYEENPKEKSFGQFIENARVTVLGVVPTLVAYWHETKCMETYDWSHIRMFSSTGECSNPNDMSYLMELAGHKPIIEYCGGTEIGGAYITSTLLEKNIPSQFTTPAMGIDFILLDETGHPSSEGEVALIPPSIGLSTELLNADHHHIYYENMPSKNVDKIIRRHGDQIKQLSNGNYILLGRVDDSMKLSGIKIGSAEIERILKNIEHITEVAAIAIPPKNGGPNCLIVFAETQESLEKEYIQKTMQTKINQELNPLIKISDIIFIKQLPRTASNKIMRRTLRDQYITMK